MSKKRRDERRGIANTGEGFGKRRKALEKPAAYIVYCTSSPGGCAERACEARPDVQTSGGKPV